VQQNIRDVNARFADFVKQFPRKMKPRGGRGGGAVFLRVNGLVALAVGEPLRDIGGQRRFARAVEHFLKNALILKIYDASARLRRLHHACAKLVVNPVYQAFLRASAGFDKRFPAMIVDAAQQKELHRAACVLPHGVKPRGDHARCVAHEHVARPEVAQNIGEDLVARRLRFPVVYEQARIAAVCGGRLRDERMGQIVVKIACFQTSSPVFNQLMIIG
jgi:hypothetical protein